MLDDEEKATSQELISNLTKALGKGFATAFYDIVDKNIRDRLNEQKDT
jgi:hypothetical protein